MMPDAMLPAMPSADAIASGGSRSAAPTAPAAASAPNTAVGWKPALCVAFGATRLSRHSSSVAGHDADEQPVAAESFALARGQDRGNNDRARMHRAALERVVEIFAVRRRAVDERGAKSIESTGVTERRARAAAIDRSRAWR